MKKGLPDWSLPPKEARLPGARRALKEAERLAPRGGPRAAPLAPPPSRPSPRPRRRGQLAVTASARRTESVCIQRRPRARLRRVSRRLRAVRCSPSPRPRRGGAPAATREGPQPRQGPAGQGPENRGRTAGPERGRGTRPTRRGRTELGLRGPFVGSASEREVEKQARGPGAVASIPRAFPFGAHAGLTLTRPADPGGRSRDPRTAGPAPSSGDGWVPAV